MDTRTFELWTQLQEQMKIGETKRKRKDLYSTVPKDIEIKNMLFRNTTQTQLAQLTELGHTVLENFSENFLTNS